jgi:GntR family transcriptional regulator/MocR family aminotransferase
MTKAATTLDLPLGDPRPSEKIWRWLYDEIRHAILSGRLKRGWRLPATRELAKQYGVSRGTVVMAFEQLHSEGYLEGRTGDGTYINASLPEDFLTARPIAIADPRSARNRPALSRPGCRTLRACQALSRRVPSLRRRHRMSFPLRRGPRSPLDVCVARRGDCWRTAILAVTRH